MSHLMIYIVSLFVEDNIRKIIVFIDNQIKLITLFFSLTDKCSNFATSSWSVMSCLYCFLTIILPVFSKKCIYLNP
ncbi:unknown [Prevotella sp. CAG:732]|nr:unknown [Prevotella sp. CAG:732]